MSTTIIKDAYKSFFVWVYNNKYTPWIFLSSIACAVILYSYLIPTIKVQPIPANPQKINKVFIPAGTEEVKDVKNILRGWGSGIALMQIERTMENYKQFASESSKHYVLIKKDLNSNGGIQSSKILLSYYSKNLSDTHVYHSTDTINPPDTQKFFYDYSLTNFDRIGNQLTANYKTSLHIGLIILSIMGIIVVSLLLMAIPSYALRQYSRRIYSLYFK